MTSPSVPSMSEPSSWNNKEAGKLPKVRFLANAWVRIWTEIFWPQSHTVNHYSASLPIFRQGLSKMSLFEGHFKKSAMSHSTAVIACKVLRMLSRHSYSTPLGRTAQKRLRVLPGHSVCCSDTSRLWVQSPVAAHKTTNECIHKWNHKWMFLFLSRINQYN